VGTLIARYASLYSAVVADVLDELGYRETTMVPALVAMSGEGTLAGRAATLRVIAVDEVPSEPYRVQFQAVDLQVDAAARPAGVVVLSIAGQYALQVPAVPDQGPVQTLGANGAYPAFGVGVRPRCPRWNLDGLHTGAGKHRIER
jgi:hypothetical protein